MDAQVPRNSSKPAEFSVATTTGTKGNDVSNLQRPAGIRDHLSAGESNTLDDALAWARHVNEGGRVALLIEGDDGTHLGKREIAGALHHREAPPR
jgi:hypothetical protein